jgi:5'-nucleotidase
MIKRRDFLTGTISTGLSLSLASSSIKALSHEEADETLITILHTNDTHSQIDPIPATSQHGGNGGIARRATLIKRVRAKNPNTLVVDAGDVFQGTPYFNLYRGEVEYKAMSAAGYDVVTLGNHEFDNGVDALAAAMKFATFDIVSSNYEVTGTPLESRVKKYVVRELGGVRIGLFGLGVKLEGLNAPQTFKGIAYLDPIETSKQVVDQLRNDERCRVVICLSHLGYYPKPKENEFGDSQLATQVDGIDLIIGGHTHTFMERPVVVAQPSGDETMIFQVGTKGIYLGRVDIVMRNNKIASIAGYIPKR